MEIGKFGTQLQQVNSRLKMGQMGVTILSKGNRLYLRGTLPPRPGANKSKPHQQEIALGISATSEGVRSAEKEARKVGGLLASGEFSWLPYIKQKIQQPQVQTIADWIAAVETDYFMRRAKNAKSLSTWQTNYLEVYQRLPLDQYLTPDVMMQVIKGTQPDTRMRQKTCLALDILAKFANVEFDAKRFSGNYSPTKVSKRVLPSDQTIAAVYATIANPAWRWCFGMLATYGLRPHEVFHLDVADFQRGSGVLHVLDGKTGARKIWPLHPEWVEQWSLFDIKVPACTGRNNKELGQRVSQYFRRQEVPFCPYDLRHAWAVRSMAYGLEVSLAAKQMGHSVAVHIQTYHAWLDDQHQHQAFERIMARANRPLPPRMG
jgi:integrase